MSADRSDVAADLPTTEEQWRARLTPERYYVLRQKGTERPWSGEYNLTKQDGMYRCAGCGAELFRSDDKFDSHCGWPSFTSPAEQENVVLTPDHSHGMIRTEVTCKRCGGHLGHVFDDGPMPTGLRYCINSLSLSLDPTEG
jgi:peptide-methionine (R)-S-oxide reductase